MEISTILVASLTNIRIMSKTIKINCSNIGQSRLFPVGVSLFEMSEILREEGLLS